MPVELAEDVWDAVTVDSWLAVSLAVVELVTEELLDGGNDAV